MKILILWASHTQPNLGVRALAAGCQEIARNAFPGAEISIQGTGTGDSPIPISRGRTLLKERLTRKHGFYDWLKTFDVILDIRGGDSFTDIYGKRRIASQSWMPEIARRLHIPYILMPQTIGPFNSRFSKVAAHRTLHLASFVAARDHQSAQRAARLGRQVDVLTTDVVFALPRPEVPKTRDIILNVSGLLWTAHNRHSDFQKYRTDVLHLARTLQAQGRTLTLLAHVLGSPSVSGDNDVFLLPELSRALGDIEVVVPEGPDALTIARQTVGSARLTIGSRMHACLNSLSMGTPAISIAYSPKFAPLLNDLGWHASLDLHSHNLITEVNSLIAGPDLAAKALSARARADSLLASFTNLLATHLV